MSTTLNLKTLTNDRINDLISLRAEAIRRTTDAAERQALSAQLVAYRDELARREIAEREAEQDRILDNYCAV